MAAPPPLSLSLWLSLNVSAEALGNPSLHSLARHMWQRPQLLRLPPPLPLQSSLCSCCSSCHISRCHVLPHADAGPGSFVVYVSTIWNWQIFAPRPNYMKRRSRWSDSKGHVRKLNWPQAIEENAKKVWELHMKSCENMRGNARRGGVLHERGRRGKWGGRRKISWLCLIQNKRTSSNLWLKMLCFQ